MNVRRRGRLPATRPLRFADGYHRRPFPCTAPGGGRLAPGPGENIPETGVLTGRLPPRPGPAIPRAR